MTETTKARKPRKPKKKGSGIEWTGDRWNPLVGCTPVSPGCLNCYAATMARRLEAMGVAEYQPRAIDIGGVVSGEAGGIVTTTDRAGPRTCRIAEVRGGRAVFTGDVRTVADRLDVPLRRRTPTVYFVNSMSDLFHEAVPFKFIDRVFAVMALCPQHTFQVLTKRPDRMAEYLNDDPTALCTRWHEAQKGIVGYDSPRRNGVNLDDLPFSNVWLGTSVEDQQRADERIPHLLRCPAAVRFLSCEPLLGPVDLSNWLWAMDGTRRHGRLNQLHWVIVGGESGPKARPCNVEWIRSIVQQCKAAGVPCFVKQLGAWPVEGGHGEPTLPMAWRWDDSGENIQRWYKPADKKGGDPSEWPEDLRVREMPHEAAERAAKEAGNA